MLDQALLNYKAKNVFIKKIKVFINIFFTEYLNTYFKDFQNMHLYWHLNT